MDKIVLIGTSHKYQIRGPNCAPADAEKFENLLFSICLKHRLNGIAEEMNWYALKQSGSLESVAQSAATLMGINHQLSDPPPEIRKDLGIICDENAFRARCWLQDWTEQQIKAAVLKSHKRREEYWLSKIRSFDFWPLLFICGAGHLKSFETLLIKNNFKAIVATPDWMPAP